VSEILWRRWTSKREMMMKKLTAMMKLISRVKMRKSSPLTSQMKMNKWRETAKMKMMSLARMMIRTRWLK
jgi:hypothetical protein